MMTAKKLIARAEAVGPALGAHLGIVPDLIAALRAADARAERAEAELAAIRAELNPPDDWPTQLAARAAVDAAKRAEKHSKDGWALVTYWQSRYQERAEAHDKTSTALRAEKARADAMQRGQGYVYIGRDGKPVLARDLEDRADRAEAELAAMKSGAA